MIEGLQFTIYGTPRTKKNSREHVKRGKKTIPLPSVAYQEWALIAKKSLRLIEQQIEDAGITRPISADVNCKALFYRHADVGDAVGFYQAVGDWMQSVGILVNDVQIRRWWGSDLLKDSKLPRIEITLDELPARAKTARAPRKKATTKKGGLRGRYFRRPR